MQAVDPRGQEGQGREEVQEEQGRVEVQEEQVWVVEGHNWNSFWFREGRSEEQGEE